MACILPCYYLFLSLAVFSSVFVVSRCHIRFICPRPQMPNSTLQSGPCGGWFNGSAEFLVDYAEVWPGLLTISLEEPTIIKDSPMKIYLLDYNNPKNKCLLLDQIPHNNEARSTGPTCKGDEYPLGGCSTATYLSVRIPDVNCDTCVLQVIQIVPHHVTPCIQTGDEFSCQTYYTCANIRIRPSSAGLVNTLATCADYLIKVPRYPFAQVQIYWNEMTKPFSGGYIYIYDTSESVSYNISYPHTAPYVGGVGLYSQQTSGIPYFVHFKKDGFYGYAGRFTPHAANRLRNEIKRDRVWIRLTYIDKKYLAISYKITVKESRHVKNTYTKWGLRYDATGVLKHRQVEGEFTTFADITYPTGQCAQTTQSYGSILYEGEKARGIAVFKWTGQKMHLVAILGKRSQADWLIEFKRPEAIGSRRRSISIPKRQITENTIKTTLPVWNFYLFAGAPPSLMTVQDKLDGEKLKMSGPVKLTLKAEIVNVTGQVRGLAMIQPINKNLLRIVVMIDSFKSRTPRPKALTLNGPASPTSLGPVLFDLLPNLADSGYADGVWVSDGIYPVDNSDLPMNMWNGELYVNAVGVQTRFNFRGQFEPAEKKLCQPRNHVLCQTCVFTNNRKQDDNLEYKAERTTARATFHFNTAKRSLDISITIDGVKTSEIVSNAFLRSSDDWPAKPIDSALFEKVAYKSKTYRARASFERTGDMNTLLLAGLIQLIVETTREGSVKEQLTCIIPTLRAPPKIILPTKRTTLPTTSTTTTTTTTTTSSPTTKRQTSTLLPVTNPQSSSSTNATTAITNTTIPTTNVTKSTTNATIPTTNATISTTNATKSTTNATKSATKTTKSTTNTIKTAVTLNTIKTQSVSTTAPIITTKTNLTTLHRETTKSTKTTKIIITPNNTTRSTTKTRTTTIKTTRASTQKTSPSTERSTMKRRPTHPPIPTEVARTPTTSITTTTVTSAGYARSNSGTTLLMTSFFLLVLQTLT